MNKILLVLTACVAINFHCSAQIDSLVNSGKCIAKARQLYDSNNYELAIKELDRIDPRDTNYIFSVSEKAKSFFENKQYLKVLEACELGLKKQSPYRSTFYLYMALGYAGQNKYDQAVATINEGLKEFPFHYPLMYRHGLFLYDQEKYDEAEEKFFKTIELTPYHRGSHLYLSKIAMRRGNKVEGMFAMGLYLALNNSDNSKLRTLESFVNNELIDEHSIKPSALVNPFSRLDEIIRAKISFEDEYEQKIPIDAGIVRQYQLLFEQIAAQTYTSESPWVRFYLTVYRDLIKAGAQEPFVYHILASSPIEEARQWTGKNEKVMQQFYDVLDKSLTQFRGTRTLPEKWGYKNPVACAYDDDSHLVRLGDKDKAGKKTGKWYYFDKKGAMLAEGIYANDKKAGVWHYFNDSGVPTSLEDSESGEIKIYDPDGALQQHYYLKDSEIDGNFQLYYSCGAVNESRGYKHGRRIGPGKNYFPNGKLKTEFNFKNDSLQGPFVEWFDTGAKDAEMTYLSGKIHGKYISYYPNGKTKSLGQYAFGKADGQWLYYHETGRLRQKGSFKADSKIGQWEIYNVRGVLTEKTNYLQQENYDQETTYYHDGALWYRIRLNKDKVVGLTYFDKAGAVIATYSNDQGTFKCKGLFPTGELQVELEYVNGVRNGQWKYYSRYGFVESVSNYIDGSLQGESLEYYSSGALQIKSNYVQGNLDGLYTEYHSNGKVRSTGWYSDGMKQQRWLSFYNNGNRESDLYYLNDVTSGYRLDYTENGKLYSKTDFNFEGKISGLTRYNEAGVESKMESKENNLGVVVQKNSSGTINYRAELSCNDWNGETNMYLSNGKLYRKLNYLNGNLHGDFTNYHSDGSIDGTGGYVDGNPTGVWKWNNKDGSKYCEGRYINGSKDSVWTYYHFNGKISSQSHFLDGEKDGESKVFGLDGQLVLVKKFSIGNLIAYKVAGKDGKLSDWIPFKGNETLTCYYANGQLAISEPYKNGEYHGLRKVFYPTGQPFNSYEYNNGKSVGKGFLYYPNGKVKQKSFYENDSAVGKWEYYDINGNLILTENYISGELFGKVEFFSNGKLSRSQSFFGGFPFD